MIVRKHIGRILLMQFFLVASVSHVNAEHLAATIQYFKTDGRIGVLVNRSGWVRYTHPGSPADTAGIQEEDHIVLVDGRRNNVENIHGTPGTNVKLTVKRKDDVFQYNLVRVDTCG